MSARTGDPVKKVVPKSLMASTRIVSELGGANRHQSSVGNVSGLAPVRCGRQGRAIVANQASTWGNSGNTQCKHSERKSLRGNGNTIPQESGCLLHSGDQIPVWLLPHNQGQGHQVQALPVKKRQRHCWCTSVCGRRVDRESFWGSESPTEESS